MELKDVLTIAISVAAFALSLIAAVLTLQRKRLEEERTQRVLLSEAIGKIIAGRSEHAKFYAEHPDADQNNAMSAVIGMYNYQINTFARLAVYIAEKIPQLVSDIEYSIIADAFGWTGDQTQALKLWEITINRSKDNYYAMLNRRTFANYLFRIGNVGGGREQYKIALSLSPPNDDYSKFTTGWIYGMWGYDELALGNRKSATDLFGSADEAFSTMSVSAEQLRQYGWQKLQAGKQALNQPASGLPPGAASMNPSLHITEPPRPPANS
jgi:tetratricopeptide (TPR) repeat protein